jgi:transposase
MQRVYERCCGLDVHSKSVVACLRTPGERRQPQKEVRTFGTTTPELLRLADWLLQAGCTHVAMESTGVYWKPVFNLLESVCEVLLVNAAHIKQVPGRKTDVKDAEWIAELLEVGLLRASFIPPQPIRELRDVTRYRKTLIQQRASEVNRVLKLLEDANIKLGHVATDVLGVSGRKMLEALIAGERDGKRLAALALGTMRKKTEQLGDALTGRFTEHHAFLLGQLLAHIDELDRHIAACDTKVAEYNRPFAQEKVERLQTIPGVSRRAAEVIVAEVGTDMNQFPTAAHLASWAGMCPGNHESAGKRKSGRTRKGDVWLRAVLVEAAWAAARTKNSYLAGLYGRLSRRRGQKKAIIAVGHSILVAVWHILKEGVDYEELGASHFDRLETERLTRHYLHRLEELGVQVTVADSRQAA